MPDNQINEPTPDHPLFGKMRTHYQSPYKQYAERIGQPFTVVREITGEPQVDAEVGPMWLIRFGDGFETEAWPEEVFDDAIVIAPVASDVSPA